MAGVLITGATGFLGREVVQAITARDPAAEVVALIRARDDAELSVRLSILTRSLLPAEAARVSAVRGDITGPRLGLEAAAYDRVLQKIDRVMHVAATTRFDYPLEEARRINVGGTEGALALCRALRARGRSGRLDYVGTTYVAGDRTDLATEEELDVGQGFRNSYEQSKLEAERAVRAAQAELPAAIYRPSIIVGDSRSGQTTSYKTIYWPMKLLVRFYGLWDAILPRFVRLPVRPDCRLDLVPVDWVASTIADLASRTDPVGRTMHLAAGPEAATIAQLVRLACDHFAIPQIQYLDPEGAVRYLGRAARPIVRKLAPRLSKNGELMLAYTRRNPTFDTTFARTLGLRPPAIADYFPRLVGFAYDRDFGAVR